LHRLPGKPIKKVSSQRDAEQADVEREKRELAAQPQVELNELAMIYVKRGLDKELAMTVAGQRLFKTGGRLIRHARYFILQLAEGHLTQRLLGQTLGRIERLAGHPT
jgi:VIT1/CCC1 family predicted Fe2+/Mn2+ transporter